MRFRLPEERPAEPPTGYKIAHPVLSQDGTRAAFTGVSLGGALPYGVLDEARCLYGRRHRPPARLCDCGFHSVHDRAAAEALLCTAENRTAVVLEVSVLGAYIRFERGFRCARQRVRTATVGPCVCGAPAVALADAGWGRPGWRVLAGSCPACVRGRPSMSPASFARLAGNGLKVRAGTGMGTGTGTELPGVGGPPGGPGLPDGLGVPELVAEAALLQARLDWFQSRLAELGGRGPGAPPWGGPPQG
ncbi:hypothetical protein [Streptomyces poonensis]|uniref:Uncharacterized protein n=1 Tax=Streptomyces poonensis TaxID=68255 RepID=A0A918Q6B2_9ACTN|nr:hypothetical protein [Streptomyces poonensis]GGZ33498.1 hypothetical protein GCM10010365_62880 [Streptomyces poonensis]GLJ89171.1 hypothetical protein GCM10017589_17710 [Streptomyces poonensis]